MKDHHPRRAFFTLTFSAMLLGSVHSLSAQPAEQAPNAPAPANSFVDLATRVKRGTTILVTDMSGRELRGTLSELTATSLGLLVGGDRRVFSHNDIALVEQRQRDSLWNGLLIGAAAGVTPAIYWRFADPNECGNSICMDDLLMGVIPSALIGLAIDAAIQKRVVLYRGSATPSARTSVMVAPIMGRGRGVELTVRVHFRPGAR